MSGRRHCGFLYGPIRDRHDRSAAIVGGRLVAVNTRFGGDPVAWLSYYSNPGVTRTPPILSPSAIAAEPSPAALSGSGTGQPSFSLIGSATFKAFAKAGEDRGKSLLHVPTWAQLQGLSLPVAALPMTPESSRDAKEAENSPRGCGKSTRTASGCRDRSGRGNTPIVSMSSGLGRNMGHHDCPAGFLSKGHPAIPGRACQNTDE
jgi:hypothetical protein